MESWRTHAASASERARLQARHAANAALLPAPAPHEGIDSSTAARPSAQILALFTHANRKGTTVWEQLGQRYSVFTGNRNSIFWIEVVGGNLDPKNWIKTNRVKPTGNIKWSYAASIVVGDAIRGRISRISS